MFNLFTKKPENIKEIEAIYKKHAKDANITEIEAMTNLSDEQLKDYKDYLLHRYSFKKIAFGKDEEWAAANPYEGLLVASINNIQQARSVLAERQSMDWDKLDFSINDIKINHYQKYHEGWASHYDRRDFCPSYYEDRIQFSVKINNRDYVIAETCDHIKKVDFSQRGFSKRLEEFAKETIKTQTDMETPERELSNAEIKAIIRENVMACKKEADVLAAAALKAQYIKEGLVYEKKAHAEKIKSEKLKEKMHYRLKHTYKEKSGVVKAAPMAAFEKIHHSR